MQNKDLICEILQDAAKTGKISLLSALHSYDKVTESHNLAKNSQQGTEIYKVLLRWGRDREKPWWEKFNQEFKEGKLTVKELDPTDPPSFGQSHAVKFFKALEETKDKEETTLKYFTGIQSLRYSPPTHDNAIKKFEVTLPKFKDFQAKLKEPDQTLSQAFRELSLKRRAWRGVSDFKSLSQHSSEVKFAASSFSNQTLKRRVLKSWHKVAHKDSQLRRARDFYKVNLVAKGLQSWTCFTLLKVRVKMSTAIIKKTRTKLYWKLWKQLHQRQEVLKGMQFTVKYIREQRLLKRVVLGFQKLINKKMHLKLCFNKALRHLKHLRLSLCLGSWRKYILTKQKGKLLYLQGYEASFRLSLKSGFRKFRNRLLYLKNQKLKQNYSIELHTKKVQSRVFKKWKAKTRVKSITYQIKKRANHFYERSTKIKVFECLEKAIENTHDKKNHLASKLSQLTTQKVFCAWKQRKMGLPFEKLTQCFFFACFKLLAKYPCEDSTPRSSLLPAVFEVKKPHLYREAQTLCARHFRSKIFKVWKLDSKVSKKRKTKLRSRVLKKYLEALHTYVRRVRSVKFIVEEHLSIKNSLKAQNILTSWQRFSHKKLSLKKTLENHLVQRKHQTKLDTYERWSSKFGTILKKRSNKAKGYCFKRNLLLGKYLTKWVKKLDIHDKKAHLSHLSSKFNFEKSLVKYWKTWRKNFLKKLKLDYRSEVLVSQKEKSLCIKVLRGWKKINFKLRQQNIKLENALTFYYRNLVTKSIKGLRNYLSYCENKERLYTNLEHSRYRMLKRASLRALRIYCNYNSKKHQRDQMLCNHIRITRQKSLFQKWYRKALVINSMKHFEQLWHYLHKTRFIERLKENSKMQKLTLAYLEVHREESLARSVLSSWKSFLNKRKLLNNLYVKFRVRSSHYELYKPFRGWMRAFFNSQKDLIFFKRAVLHIANDFKKQTFDSWKLYSQRRLRKKFTAQHRTVYLQQQVFSAWAYFSSKKTYLLRMQEELHQRSLQGSRSQMFYRWLCLAIKRQQAEFNANSFLTIQLQRWFGTWKKEFHRKTKQRTIIVQVKKLSEFLYKSKAFKGICYQADMTTYLSHINKKAQKFHLNSLQRKAWLVLYHFSQESLTQDNKASLIQQKVNKRLVKNTFESWLWEVVDKIKNMRACQKLSKTWQNYQLKFLFADWSKNIQSLKMRKKLSWFFHMVVLKLNQKKCFSALVEHKNSNINYRQLLNNFANSKENKTKVKVLKLLKETKNLRKTFNNIKNYWVLKSKHRVLIHQKQDSTLKKALVNWLKYSKKKLNLNSLLEEFSVSHNSGIAGKAFWYWNYIFNKKKDLRGILDTLQQSQLHMWFESWKTRTQHKLDTKQNYSRADSVFTSNTAHKFFKKLIEFVQLNKKTTHKKKKALEFRNKKLTLEVASKFFQASKKAILVKENYQTFVYQVNLKLSKKLLSIWVKESTKRIKLKDAALALEQTESSYLVRNCLQTWLTTTQTTKAKTLLDKFYSCAYLKILQKRSFSCLKNNSKASIKSKTKLTKFTEDKNLKLQESTYLKWRKLFQKQQLTKTYLGTLSKVSEKYTQGVFFNTWKLNSKQSYEKQEELKLLQAQSRYQNYLKLKVLVAWRLWLQQRFETMIQVEEHTVHAYEHYQKDLIARVFHAWIIYNNENSIKKRRSLAHSVFSAWKIFARENSLLKKYLQESNLPDRYMRTSRDQQGSALATLRSVSSMGSLSSH